MVEASRGRPRALALAIVLTSLAAPARGQGPAPGRDGERAARLAEMQEVIRAIRITDPARPALGPVPPLAEPLHRWSDPTRDLSDGSLWAFGKVGRPIALVAAELYGGDPKVGPAWSCEFNSLAPGPILGESDRGFFRFPGEHDPEPARPLRWTPTGPGVELTTFGDARPPGPTEAERLREMKGLAARFAAHEEGGGPPGDRPRYELRLLPRPIHRYADPAAGLLDGAIFVLAYGTNPELLLLVEARKPASAAGAAAWGYGYGFARLSTAAVSARLGGDEVWARPFAQVPDPESPYFFILTPRQPGD